MAKKVFNMAGGSHSAAALSAFLNAAFAGKVANGLKVVETGVTGLNVIVQPGTGQIDTGQGFSRVIQIDADETIALSPASPSNPRRDLIVAYIDNTVTPTTSVVDNINDVLKIAAVAGAPAGSPVDPSGSAIQSAIGAGNPYIILARVRVAQSATSLSNSVIDDLREMALITRSDQLSSGIIAPRHIAETDLLAYHPSVRGSGGLGIGNLTASLFRYQKYGNLVFVTAHIEGTSTGTPSHAFQFDLPIPRSSSSFNMAGGAAVKDGSAYMAGYYEISGFTVNIRKTDGGNFGLGTYRGFNVSFWYFI